MEDKHIYSTSFWSKLQDKVSEFVKEIKNTIEQIEPKRKQKELTPISMEPLKMQIPQTPVNTSISEEKVEIIEDKKPKVKKTKKAKKHYYRKLSNEKIQKSLVTVLIIAIVTIFSLGVFLSYQETFNFQAIPNTSKQSQKTSPTPLVDTASNWKTYKNEKFKFEFEYPNKWRFQNYFEDSMVSIDPHSLILEKELIAQNIPPGIISIQVTMESPNLETYCWKDLPYYTLLSSKSLGYENNILIKFIENYNIPEKQSQFYQNKYRLDYYFCSNNGTNVHAILVVNQNEKSLYIPLFDQILSTFKFLD